MIQVNEIFGPTVQGEGKSAGKPCAFLRLATCNLHCIWCDTPHTWNWTGTPFAHTEKYDRTEEVHKMSALDIYGELFKNAALKFLVISGGEPFLQQRQLMPLLQILKHNRWWIEVETNGTLVPKDDFMVLVDQVNCSPKLANALDPLKLRRRPLALKALAANDKVNFKFVIQHETDLAEALNLVDEFSLREVRLMPECRTKEELLEKEPWLKDVCEKHGFIYCTRLSILTSGTTRGV